MATLRYPPGTIVSFDGVDGRRVHMGFVWDKTHVMELMAGLEDGNHICRIYLTHINSPHPLLMEQPSSRRLPKWFHHEEPPQKWSLERCIHRISNAFKEFNGSEYHRVYNNCQHFAYRASQGEKKSPDSDGWKLVGWLAGSGGESASLASQVSGSYQCQQYRSAAVSAIRAIQSMQHLREL